MVSLKRGDDVKTLIEIKNGMLTPNVKKGAKGTILAVKPNSVMRVHFPNAGFFWPEVDCDVKTDYLDKI